MKNPIDYYTEPSPNIRDAVCTFTITKYREPNYLCIHPNDATQYLNSIKTFPDNTELSNIKINQDGVILRLIRSYDVEEGKWFLL